MKSKIFVFTTLILVVFLFVITSCDNFLNAKNKTTININLDLSKILKTSRNETTTSITEYILKVFAYNAATYKPENEIQNLPLLTQTENKVDINGNVKASLDVEIGLNVIFVAKLYQGKSEKPLYAGKSEVIKIKATDNKVDLVLKRANTDLEIDIEVHQHTFGEYVSNNDATTEADGTKTRECSVCGYEETVVDEGSKIIVPEFVFVKGDTVTGALPAWLDESASDYYKGVFIKDRTVTLSDFYMGKYEVTQKEYSSVMAGQKVTVEGVEYELESNPSYCTADSTLYTLFNGDVQEKRPVEGVTWYDSVWYCNALSEKEGLTKAYDIEVTQVKQESGKTGYYIWGAYVTLNKNANGYRLPTEAEWEYAARGGDPTKDDWNYVFSGADTTAGVSYDSEKNADLDSVGWYWYNSINGTTGDTKPSRGEQGFGTHQVGKKAPNRLGLYDMSGNVYEWCYDWYGTITTTTPADGLATSGSVRVHRGGGWSVSAPSASVSYRSYTNPYYRFKYLGFRVVRSATEVIDHTHKFATDWTKDETHHWHAATCEHTDEKSGFAEHSFGNWTTTKEATEEAEGSRERSCTVCGYTATEVIEKLAHTHKFADGICVCGLREDFVFVKGGTVVGAKYSNNYEGVFIEGRTVTLSDFYMGKYEVTQEEYASVMVGQKVTVNGTDYALERDPSYCTADSTKYTLFRGDVQEKRPVEGVTWYDAVWYCNALSEIEGLTKAYNIEVTEVLLDSRKTGYYISEAIVSLVENANGYRLPTEAEWEYAARGGDPTKDDWNYVFSGADTAAGVSYSSTKNAGLDSVGWYCYNSKDGTTGDTYPSSTEQGYGTHQVGKKASNRLGLYDMSGNVSEWCYDWSGTITTTTPADGATSGSYRIYRGAGWNSNYAYAASVSYRSSKLLGDRGEMLGFRVVRPATTD